MLSGKVFSILLVQNSAIYEIFFGNDFQ